MWTDINTSGTLFINGLEPKPTLVCPTLDPTASIQITDALISVYQSRIDAVINQLGKSVMLEFTPIKTDCPNCWTSGAMISTPNGPQQIQDIEPGDYVFSPSGNIRRVNGVFTSRYDGKLFNIKCYGISMPEFMTADHKLPVVRKMRSLYTQRQWIDHDYILTDPCIQLVRAQDIEIGDALIMPNVPHNNNDLKTIYIDGFGDIDCTDDFLNFLGWWLAEGCVHKSKYPREITFCLCASKENEIADYLIDIGRKIFDLKGTKTFRTNADNLLVNFYSTKLTKFLMKFGLYAWNKSIPHNLFVKLSQRQLCILFDAYGMGDGNIYTNSEFSIYSQYSIITTSKILAFQIFECLTRDNLIPSIRYRKGRTTMDGVKHREFWGVVWFPDRKQQKSCVRASNIGKLSMVRDIEQIKSTTIVYNINVDVDHQYIVNGIASKNCTFDMIRGRSRNVYTPGGPVFFDRGRKCPWCKGRGFLETPVQKCIRCLIRWNAKDALDYGISVSRGKNIVRFKTHLYNFDDMVRAEFAISNHDIRDMVELKVRIIKSPIITGLREDRYCISFWEAV